MGWDRSGWGGYGEYVGIINGYKEFSGVKQDLSFVDSFGVQGAGFGTCFRGLGVVDECLLGCRAHTFDQILLFLKGKRRWTAPQSVPGVGAVTYQLHSGW